ncbi:hypothetical protein WIS52_30520 [Pseudonocardia nematodicida]|uniref:MarR family transcriptional regulator n=1 Tax=Pseudonocardia nematodicida TaxID=1206997 RepID=A0ABV1KK33_9PSEU
MGRTAASQSRLSHVAGRLESDGLLVDELGPHDLAALQRIGTAVEAAIRRDRS